MVDKENPKHWEQTVPAQTLTSFIISLLEIQPRIQRMLEITPPE